MSRSETGGRTRPSILAFLPVYNEETHISALLDRFQPVLEAGTIDELIVVDDGSTDRTPEILRERGFCTVITNSTNLGISVGIRSAYQYAVEHGYDVFIIMAGNGKDDPAQIERLLAPILRDEADYVQGSRFLDGGHSAGLPEHRRIAMRAFTRTFSIFTGQRFTDCTNGFRAYRTSLLQDPRLDWSQSWLGDRYQLEYYMHYKAAQLGYRVMEVPVSKIYRRALDGSYSKVRYRDWLPTLKPLFLLRLGLKK